MAVDDLSIFGAVSVHTAGVHFTNSNSIRLKITHKAKRDDPSELQEVDIILFDLPTSHVKRIDAALQKPDVENMGHHIRGFSRMLVAECTNLEGFALDAATAHGLANAAVKAVLNVGSEQPHEHIARDFAAVISAYDLEAELEALECLGEQVQDRIASVKNDMLEIVPDEAKHE